MKNNKIKLIAYLGMLALLASLIVGLLGFSNSTKDINDVKHQLLKKHVENNINLTMKYINNSYGTLTAGDETLHDSDGNSIEGRFGVVDTILEDLGDKSTIFVKVKDDFKRISTNIMSDENERAIGTFLGTDHSAYQTVMKGELYIGEAEILNENYYTAYQPIKDNNNNVIGLLFVGMPTDTLNNIAKMHDAKMSKINILIILLRAISLGSLIALVSASVMARKHNTPTTYTSKEFFDIYEQFSLVLDEIDKQNLDKKAEEIKIIISKLKNNTDESTTMEDINILIEEQIAAIEQFAISSVQLTQLTERLNQLVNEKI